MTKLLVLLALVSLTMGRETLRTQRISSASGYHSNQASFGTSKKGEGALFEVGNKEDIFEINQKFPELQLTNGDISFSKSGRNGITNTDIYWPNAVLPIQLSSSLNELGLAGIEEARVEYEMRTCLTLPYRTNEENYLSFEQQSGCWSYVGVQEGPQTVSIGSGCENSGVVIHEIMHAAGIYHEQSRTDRDNYITIVTDNIDPGLVYNFDKYDYSFVDNRRVQYDYNSLMHYSDTSFTTNGGKTILTKNPDFQDVIGQRRTFSEGDATLLNRMYSCSDTRRISYTCNFEEDTLCGYVQGSNDETDWIKYDIGKTDGKLISPNIPDFDNTYGKSGEGSFMLLDTTSKQGGSKANLVSMRLKSNNPKQCLEFNYYMDLDSNSDAGIGVYLGTIDQLTGEIVSTQELRTIIGDHGSYWNTEQLTIEAPDYYKLIVVAKSGAYSDDVIAFDDISVLDKPCDSAYFVINDFSELLASTNNNDFVYSPVLYDEEGYAFKLQIFPHGTDISSTGNVGFFFVSAQGANDNQLSWPYNNRVIKLNVVDRSPNAVTRMHHHWSFHSDSSAKNWVKPTQEIGENKLGYNNFVSLDEILNSRNFLKNDAVMFSANVRNMNTFTREHAQAFAQPEVDSRPKLIRSRHHEHDLEPEKKDLDVNVIIHHPQENNEEEDEETMSTSLLAGIAIACSLGVFMLMSLVMICMNQSHKQSLNALSLANYRLNEKSNKIRFNNLGYAEEKA